MLIFSMSFFGPPEEMKNYVKILPSSAWSAFGLRA